MVKEVLVVAHGDLDGIISAAMVVKRFELSLDSTEITFVQPFTVDKVKIPEVTERVFVVDVAVNNRDPEMTKNFIRRLGDRLVLWCDHHQGWASEITGDNKAFMIRPEAKSCAGIIALGDEFDLWRDADAADSREGELSPRSQIIEQAMKANMSDDSIRQLAVKWLLGDETAKVGLEEAAKKYAKIQIETERLAAEYVMIGNVAVIDARRANHQYDLTQLLLAGQTLSPFAIVRTVHPQQGEGITVATSRKDVNLVELFGLGSGASFRVSLPSKRLEEVLAKLAKI